MQIICGNPVHAMQISIFAHIRVYSGMKLNNHKQDFEKYECK